jgi:hypothetical protein
MELFKALLKFSIVPMLLAAAGMAQAAQLSTDARGAIPRDVQQLVVIDYRAMQNSSVAMGLRNRVMPPELKQFDEALRHTALNDRQSMDQYVDQLAFALFRTTANSESLSTVGVAQGQFPVDDIKASFRAKRIRATMLRSNAVYPMARTGMVLCFVDPSTMLFGDKAAVDKALDARDGILPSLLSNGPMMNAMQSVDSNPLWSILDNKGTQTMMKQLMGQAGSVADFDSVRKRLQECWYAMDFAHGVHFELTISTGDAFAASTVSSLLTAAVMVRKMSSSDAEKQALNDTSIASNSGQLNIRFASSDTEFESLLKSPLFQSMVR